MFDLTIGSICHMSFNGDDYPYIVVGEEVYRNRKVVHVVSIPFEIGGIQIIPKMKDYFAWESVNTLLVTPEKILELLKDKKPTKLIQSVKKTYWHPLGESKPTFNWHEGMSYRQNPHI